MYSPRMRRATLFILALACVSLFAVQVSGLHLHVEAGGHDEDESHGPHLQQAYSHDLNHGGAHVDVVVFESASGSIEVDILILNSAVSEFSTMTPLQYRWPVPASSMPLRQHSRWRPPLRAPPYLI